LADEANWKTELLASNLPLEFEAAGVLVSAGFTVDSDFRYTWVDAEAGREAAIGIRATGLPPFADPEQATGTLDLLLQCRYRPPGAGWLFLPDPNPPDRSPATLGHTIRMVDAFSLFSVDAKAAVAFDVGQSICHKGLEIDVATGDVSETELTRGLEQLRYALPRLLIENVRRCLNGGIQQSVPLLFCPILLTSAELFVADKGLSEMDVAGASDLGELATAVPYAIFYSGYSPGLQAHCTREFRQLEPLARSDKFTTIEDRRARHFKTERELPYAIIQSLIAGDPYWLHRLFTQFIVCTKSELPALVDAVKQTAVSAMQSRRQLP